MRGERCQSVYICVSVYVLLQLGCCLGFTSSKQRLDLRHSDIAGSQNVPEVCLVLQHVHHPDVRLHVHERHLTDGLGLQTQADHGELVGLDQQILQFR